MGDLVGVDEGTNVKHPSDTLPSPQLSKYPQLVSLERRTNVPKAYFGLGIAGVMVFFIFFNIAAGFISNMLGYIVPGE